MPDLYPLARKLLWQLSPERAHKAALLALRLRLGFLVTGPQHADSPILGQSLWGLRFSNPVGVAAGFDKDALVPNEILNCGFGAVEVGTVTPQPQRGNDAPRLFRLDQENSIINRMGFPSAGLNVVEKRLSRRRRARGVVGVNIGKNRETADAALDYAEGVRRMAPYADYLVINISSPNTPGLRDLQRREPLEALISRVIDARSDARATPPLLVKIAPDLSIDETADIASVCLSTGIDGIIIANTTIGRPSETTTAVFGQAGGLSGPYLFERSTKLLSDVYALTSGRIPLIGVGGISNAEEAYAKIRAGASLIQIYTALIFAGMSLAERIKSGLTKLLAADGFANISDAVGVDHRRDPRTSSSKPVQTRTRPRRYGPATQYASLQGDDHRTAD